MRTPLHKLHNAGLTLIEMLIVVAIVAIVSGIIMFNFSSFTTNVSVRNLAQDIALAIRKAQSYATSVQALPGGSTSSYPAYGMVFSLDTPSSNVALPSTKRFILFADVNGDGQYEAGTTCGAPTVGSECVESFAINGTDTVSQICSGDSNGTSGCSSSGTVVAMEFCRPAPDAAIYLNGGGVPACGPTTISYAEIVVKSAKGLLQHVRLWNTGQISVQ